jgi:hypothetical protein
MSLDSSFMFFDHSRLKRSTGRFSSLAIRLNGSVAVCQNMTYDPEAQFRARFQFMQDGQGQWAIAKNQRAFCKLRLAING